MRKLIPALVVSAVLVPSGARAGLSLGARAAFALPGGDIDAGEKMGDFIDWAVPLQLEVGWRFQQAGVGAYVRYAPGKMDASLTCTSGATCRASDIGLGAQGEYRFERGPAGPWLGGFLGADILRYDASYGSSKASISTIGWEVGAQGGLDFALGSFSFGPYGSIGVGRYGSSTLDLNGTTDTQTIADQATHTWIQVGIRGTFAF